MGGITQPNSGVGIGQTWQDVKASRALGTTYYNTTAKPITVSYTGGGNGIGSNYVRLWIDGALTMENVGAQPSGFSNLGNAIGVVPVGSSYRAEILGVGAISVGNWFELR